jgi:hypothetical protein
MVSNMIRCAVPFWIIGVVIWVLSSVFHSSLFHQKNFLTEEDSQVPSLGNYTLGDSAKGVTWFIQVSDMHLESVDKNTIESFRFY